MGFLEHKKVLISLKKQVLQSHVQDGMNHLVEQVSKDQLTLVP